MGCYNATCFMSNTPILSGEKIAIFVLAPKHTDTEPGLGCISESKFKPVGFPIIAEFDEDTDFRNINHVSPYAERYFREHLHLYCKDRSVDDETVVFQEYQWESFEKFLNHLVGWELFVKCEDGVIRRLSYAMMHEELRQCLLDHASSRVPYGKTETYQNLMVDKVQKAIEECKIGYNNWLKLPEQARQKYCWDSKFSLWAQIDYCETWDNLDTMVTYYVLAPDDDIINDIVEYAIWLTVMCYSRKGYHCYPIGSQCEDMQYLKIIAEFTLQKYNERKHTRRVEEYLSF